MTRFMRLDEHTAVAAMHRVMRLPAIRDAAVDEWFRQVVGALYAEGFEIFQAVDDMPATT